MGDAMMGGAMMGDAMMGDAMMGGAMMGGAMMAEGGFGCVFHPAISCPRDSGDDQDSKENGEYISKIVKRDFNSQNEIDMGNKIKKIAHWGNFFNVTTSYCDINIAEIDAEGADKCESFKKYPGKEFIILRMPYIDGKPLALHLSDETLNDKQRQRQNLQGYLFLLDGLIKLINANVVHNDIKSGNILFSVKTDRPIIIDFGLSFEVSRDSGLLPVKSFDEKNLYKYFYIYAPEYYLWAPEIHFINYLLHKSRYVSKDIIKIIADDIVDKNVVLQKYFSEDFIVNYKKTLTSEFIALHNKSKNPLDLINLLISKSWKTWDNFSLSVFYIKYIRFTYGQSPLIGNEYILTILEILLTNISPYVFKRLSPLESKEMFLNWLKNSGIKGGQEIINYRKVIGENPKLYIKNLVSKDISEIKDLTTRKEWLRKLNERGE